MIADLEGGHRNYPTPGLIYWASLPAFARQAVLDGRRAEIDLRHSDAVDHFVQAIRFLERTKCTSPLVPPTRAAAVAGLARLLPKDPMLNDLLPGTLNWFEDAARTELDAADYADHVSLLGDGQPVRARLVEKALRAGHPPAWLSLRLGEGEVDEKSNRRLVWAAVREAPMAPAYHLLMAEFDDRPAADRSSEFTIAAARFMADGDFARARDASASARSLDPSNIVAAIVWADLQRLAGDVEQAIALLESIRLNQQLDSDLDATAVRSLARALEAAGRRMDALEMVEHVLDREDAPSDDFVFAGRVRSAQGDPDGARSAFDRALEIDPDQVPVIYTSVKSWVGTKRYDRAIDELERALRRQPGNPHLQLLLGHTMARAGTPEAHVKQIERATDLGMDAAEAWSVLSFLHADQGDRRGAADALERALKLQHRKDPALLTDRGALLLELGESDEAVRLLRTAVRKRSGDSALRQRLAEALLAAGKPNEALSALDAALRKLRDDPDLLAWRGRVHRRLGDLDAAERDLRRSLDQGVSIPAAVELFWVLRERSDEAVAITSVVECLDAGDIAAVAFRLVDADDYAGAEAMSAAGLDLIGSDASGLERAQLLLVRGWAQQQLDEPSDPQESLRGAVAAAPEYSEAHAFLGAYLFTTGQLEEATSEVLEARRLSPGSVRVAAIAVDVLKASCGVERALEELDAAIHQIGEDPDLLTLRVRVLLTINRPREALDLATELEATGTPKSELRRTKGAALLSLGRYDEAAAVFDHLLDESPDDVEIRVNLATALNGAGNAQRAAVVLGDIAPDAIDAEILSVRGQIRHALHDKGCLSDLKEALDRDAGLSDARMELVDAAAEYNEQVLARQHLAVLLADAALADDPEVVRLAWLLDQQNVALERIERIVAKVGADVANDPTESARLCQVLVFKSAILLERGDIEPAIDAARSALELDDSATQARLVLSNALQAVGSLDEALAVLEAAQDPLLVSERVVLLLELDRDREAELLVRRITEGPTDDEFALQLYNTLIRYGVLLPPARFLESRLAASPSASILVSTGDLLSAMGEFERAVSLLELARHRNYSDLDAELAWAYRNLEPPRQKEALRALNRALRHEPGNRDLVRLKADALCDTGHISQARTLYRKILKAVSAEPSSGAASWQAGWCSYRLGEYERALDHLLRAISTTLRRDGGDRFDLGLVLLVARRPGRAHREVAKAIEEGKALASPLKRHGILRVALADLRALQAQPPKGLNSVAARKLEAMLRRELKAARSSFKSVRHFLGTVDDLIAAKSSAPRRGQAAVPPAVVAQ